MIKEFNKVALSFHAHPDDAEAWNAGVLKLLKDKGYKIVIATMTAGDLGGCNMAMEETANIVETAALVSYLDTVPVKEKPLEITPLLYHTSPLTLSDTLGSQIVPPHFFVNIATEIETKKKMLGCHISQIEFMQHMHKMNDFFGYVLDGNQNFGKMAGVEYAEAYWQHLGGGFQKEPQIQNDLSEFIINKMQ